MPNVVCDAEVSLLRVESMGLIQVLVRGVRFGILEATLAYPNLGVVCKVLQCSDTRLQLTEGVDCQLEPSDDANAASEHLLTCGGKGG